MKYYLLIIFTSAGLCFSCGKTNEPIPNSNELMAQVVFSSDTTVTIHETGYSAHMGCAFGTTGIDGANDTASINITINSGKCVTTSGNYTSEFECQVMAYNKFFVKDPAKPGSISFIAGSNAFMQGSFNIVCYNGNDSVLVSGTFKGSPFY